MNSILKNIIAVVAGWLIGSIVNMGLIQAGHSAFPIAGVDINDMDAMAEVMPTLDAKHFIFPFLAHALGTLVGATIAGIIAANHKMKFALGIGVLFLIGGIWINTILSGPTWFTIVDLIFAYLPMAVIGGMLALKFSPRQR